MHSLANLKTFIPSILLSCSLQALSAADQVEVDANGVRINSSLTVNGRIISNDAAMVIKGPGNSDAETLSFLSFQRQGSTEKGWLGYGEGASGRMQMNNSIGDIKINPTGKTLVSSDLSVAGSLVLENGTSYIRTDTSDGSDTKRTILCGSSSAENARGGYLVVNGNEYSGQEGGIGFSAGNNPAYGHIDFYTKNSNIRMRVQHDGKVRVYNELMVGSTNVVQAKVDPNGNPNVELRGSGKQPYIDFATTSNAYDLRLIANNTTELELKGGSLRVSGGDLITDQATYPDYVFEDDYDLLPIEDVAEFILKNKRLPNVKSAEEVVKNGMSMGAQVVMQMEKIEELTLYTIDQHEQIKRQNEKIEQQAKLIEALSKRLESLEEQQ